MFGKLIKDPFLFFVFGCVIVLVGLGIWQYLTNGKGSWSNTYYRFDKDIKELRKSDKKDSNFPKKDSRGETECRRVLEEIFQRDFTKARPNFLNNPITGGYHNLELDCFNPELRLAVEYQGVQHSQYTPFFHKNKEAFLNGKYRDELKRRMCKDNMITLIEVPHTIKQEDIRRFLTKELYKHGYVNTNE